MTYAFAIGGAILLALTLTPVLAAQVHPGADTEEKEHARHARAAPRATRPLFRARAASARGSALAIGAHPGRRRRVLVPVPRRRVHAASSRRATSGSARRCRRRSRSSSRRSTSGGCAPSSAAARRTRRRRATRRTARTPRSMTVVSQLGRPDDGTDVAGFHNIELFAPLKPFDEWPRGMTKEKLTDELSKELERGVPRRRLQLLADDQRQRRGGRLPASRARTRSRSSAPTSRRTSRTPTAIVDVDGDGQGREGPRHVPLARASRASRSRPTARRARATASTPATSRRSSRRRSAARPSRRSTRARSASTSRCAGSSRTASSLEAIREITVSTPDGSDGPARADREDHARRRARASSIARTGSATRR